MPEEKKLTAQEQMKIDSKYLKGDILQELANDKPDISDYSYELMKFHGSYFAFDRDTATQRKKAGQDKRFEFMIRLRVPAGEMTADEYLAMDDIASKYANNTMRITTRQAIQLHVILKENVKECMKEINKTSLSTRSACGDVVRNITTSAAPFKNAKFTKLRADSHEVAEFVMAQSSANDELWCGANESNRDVSFSPKVGVQNQDGSPSPLRCDEDDKNALRCNEGDKVEPLYGKTYLPRKFKIGLILPEDNSIDMFTHDLGIVLVYQGDELQGYNLYVGGGMGMSHEGKLKWADKKTYPRLATPLCFVGKDDLINSVEAIVKFQRDNGDRTNRKHARLKYVVQERGIEFVRSEFEKYFTATNPAQPISEIAEIAKIEIPSHMGWHEQGDGKLFLGVPVPSGRIVDYDISHEAGYNTGKNEHHKNARYRSGLNAVIKEYGMKIVLTPTEEIILCDINPAQKSEIADKLQSFGIVLAEDHTKMALTFMACVSLPTCAKALAESERVQFDIMDDVQAVLDKHGLRDEDISVRVTGCPNGCARPYVGDIGLVGRMPGHYTLFIGGDFEGTRLSTRILDKLPQADIAVALEPMFKLYAADKSDGEGFGDFCHRVGVQKVTNVAIQASADKKWAVIVE